MTAMQNHWIDSKYLKDFGICHAKSGQNVVYQTGYMTDTQLRRVKKDGIPIIFVFGDNDKDKLRDKSETRMGMAGQAQVAGKSEFENIITCGVITLWYSEYDASTKVDLWGNTFRFLLDKIWNGYTIVVPSPSKQDLDKYHHKFFNKNDRQVIFHNMGTGIAGAPTQDLQTIQNFLDNLEQKCFDFRPCSAISLSSSQQRNGSNVEMKKEKPIDNTTTDSSDIEKQNLQKLINGVIDLHLSKLKEHSNEKEQFENDFRQLKEENEKLRKALQEKDRGGYPYNMQFRK